jgi:hypothetical protein
MAKSLGATFLWTLRRVTPETAFGAQTGGDMSKEMSALYDRACLLAASRAMREWRFHRQSNPVFYGQSPGSPLDKMSLWRRLLTAAVEDRDRFCRIRRVRENAPQTP